MCRTALVGLSNYQHPSKAVLNPSVFLTKKISHIVFRILPEPFGCGYKGKVLRFCSYARRSVAAALGVNLVRCWALARCYLRSLGGEAKTLIPTRCAKVFHSTNPLRTVWGDFNRGTPRFPTSVQGFRIENGGGVASSV